MLAVQVQLAALGWTRIRCFLDVLTSASRPFWSHLGYREWTRQRDDAGRDVVVLERRLP